MTALDGIPWNQPRPPSLLRQARIFFRSSPVSSAGTPSREATRRVYQASVRDRTSSERGSTCLGIASLTISSTEISFRTASEPGTFTKRERSSSSRASRDIPSSSTAEWASESSCAAGNTGTSSCTASENSAVRKEAFRVRVPASAAETGKLRVSTSPGFTVTGSCCTQSPALSSSVPETGASAIEDTVTAASKRSPL